LRWVESSLRISFLSISKSNAKAFNFRCSLSENIGIL
jgi:hypothetical protein